VTMDYYGHVLPGYLRDEIDRLKFNSPDTASAISQAVAGVSSQLVTTLL
jgi:hypothetical protein